MYAMNIHDKGRPGSRLLQMDACIATDWCVRPWLFVKDDAIGKHLKPKLASIPALQVKPKITPLESPFGTSLPHPGVPALPAPAAERRLHSVIVTAGDPRKLPRRDERVETDDPAAAALVH